VEVFDLLDVPLGPPTAQAGVMGNDMVLLERQMAQFEGRMSTMVKVGDNEGPAGPPLGPGV